MSHVSTCILVPCRNAGQHLEPMLRSLLAQTRQDFELTLIDDASDDGSPATARRICGDRIKVYENPERLGIAGNWNAALAHAHSEYVCLAHQDDVYDPAFLEQMIAALESSSSAGLAHCQARTIDDDGREIRSPIETFKNRHWHLHANNGEPATVPQEYGRLLAGNFICCPSVVYRKAALDATPPFDEASRFTMDWQRYFELLLAKFSFAALPRALISYRRHRSNASHQAIETLDRYREELKVLAWASEQGKAQGLLASDSPASHAVRNNLLYDAYRDLEDGRAGDARAKLAFGKQEIPGFASDFLARSVGACARLGRLGVWLLRCGLFAYLKLPARKRH